MIDGIVVASTETDYEVFAFLIREYWQWLRDRYADLPGFIDAVGGHQALDAELGALAQKYGPPEGKTLLAVRDGQVRGAIAYRDLHDGACEMKRLFVPDRFQGQGTGRSLCRALLELATADGFSAMRLDTGYQNDEALLMYESLGFVQCPPYHEYPAELVPHLRFLEKSLATT
ncbi:MAG: GNAT family N-acetyltransferase [Candidatus Nanopelagicales bacterium]